MQKIDAILSRLFLILCSSFCCLIAIELFARFYLWNIASDSDFRTFASITQIKDRYGDDFLVQDVDKRNLSWSPHHFLGHVPTPNYRHGANKHNAMGFRGEEFEVDKPANAFRIVAIGGSTTYSIDVQDYRHSYPYLLEEHLHESGFDDIEVINAGAAGYTSHQNLINLQFRALPLQPDMVLVYQGFNDIAARIVYPYSRYLGDGSGSVSPVARDIFMPDIAEYSTASRILGIWAGLTTSHAALELQFTRMPESARDLDFARQYQSGRYPSGVFEEASVAEMLANNPPAHFERNLLNQIAVAERHNANLSLITMALDADYHDASGNNKNRKYSSDEYVHAMRQHNELTRRIAAQTGAPLLDLAALFPDDHRLFTDGLHMNEAGNRKRAQLIGDFIISQLAEASPAGDSD